MRTAFLILGLAVVIGGLLFSSHASHVCLHKVDDGVAGVTFILENKTRCPLVTEFIGTVHSSAAGPVSNGVRRASFLESGSNRVLRVVHPLDADQRLVVSYRHRESRFEERVRRLAASVHLCSEHSSRKELRWVQFP
jgi:hypothetical protein